MVAAESQNTAGFPITLTEDEQEVNAERDGHPDAHVRRNEEVLDRVWTTHAETPASLMTLNFQEFDNVSFLAA